MTLTIKGKTDAHLYKRPCIEHTLTGDVIVQHKAWNDAVGTAMWVDVQVGPQAKKRGRPFLLVWGNCDPHTVQALRAVFDEWGILTAQLPPRTTSILQVMDLVVNGPVNTAIRKARCDRLMDYMQDWKRLYALEMTKPIAERCIPAYDPPNLPSCKGCRRSSLRFTP